MDFIKTRAQIRSCMVVSFLWIAVFPCAWCIEEYQREIFLAPRNFNPHPYEHHLAKFQDPGPVVFPIDKEEEESGNRYNIITVDSTRTKHPVDNNPYRKVTDKIKYLINKKFSDHRENQVGSDLFDALAEQGAKVLTYSPHELKNYGENPLRKKNYAFAYKVLDKATGDDFSHHQTRSAKATNGEYRVKLPDGRLQIVSYKADKNGYKADVKYEEDTETNHQRLVPNPVVPATHQYESYKVPTRQVVPRGRIDAVNNYDYLAEEENELVSPLRDSNVVILEQAGPSQVPVNYVDIAVYPTPRPSYLVEASPEHQFQGQHYPNVQIYTTNPREQHFHGHVSTTPATPVYNNNVVRYTSTPVPPTAQTQIGHNGENGLFTLNVVRPYANPVIGPPGHKNVINTIHPSSNPNDAYRETLEQENELPEGIYIVGKTGKR